MRLSAYMSIFDDWDLLPHALAAVAPHADEIVVVDGAYRWMAPMLRAGHRDPSRSLPDVYAALAPYADKLRVIDGLWDNELEKRAAGYAACRGRYVLRFDADEIMFLTPELIDAAIARGFPVVEVEMPTYALPGWLHTRPLPDGSLPWIERQCVLFDQTRISTHEHLCYLWLVLSQAERARLPPSDAAKVDPTPLAFNAHFTGWRKPDTAAHRARFYVMKWMREAGVIPWFGGVPATADDGFSAFFAAFPPAEFETFLLGHEIAAGQPAFGSWSIRRAPDHPAHDQLISAIFEELMVAHVALNGSLRSTARPLLFGVPCCIDISTPESVMALSGSDQELVFCFDKPLTSATATLQILMPSVADEAMGHAEQINLRIEISRHSVVVSLPGLTDWTPGQLRRTLVIEVVPEDRLKPLHMLTAPDSASPAKRFARARAATDAADWPAAVTFWQDLLTLDDNAEETHLRLGEALRGLTNPQSGDEFCAEAWRKFPGNIWIGRNWALIASCQGQWREAARRYRVVANLHAHDVLQADLAECLLAEGEVAEADAVLTQAQLDFPHSIWVAQIRNRRNAG